MRLPSTWTGAAIRAAVARRERGRCRRVRHHRAVPCSYHNGSAYLASSASALFPALATLYNRTGRRTGQEKRRGPLGGGSISVCLWPLFWGAAAAGPSPASLGDQLPRGRGWLAGPLGRKARARRQTVSLRPGWHSTYHNTHRHSSRLDTPRTKPCIYPAALSVSARLGVRHRPLPASPGWALT